MPIKAVATATSPNSSVKSSNLDDETKSKLYTLIEAYLLFMPRPSDAQVHALAEAIGMSHEELEAGFYELFGDIVRNTSEEIEDLADEDEDEDDEEDFEGVKSSFGLTSGDELGDAASTDGAPDKETHGQTDPLKENSGLDGAPDTEQIKENLGKDQ